MLKRYTIRLIIILAAISMPAALVTQFFWIKEAWDLKKKQFDDRIHIALKSVVNQLLTTDEYPPTDPTTVDTTLFFEHLEFLSQVNVNILDSLLCRELSEIDLSRDYYWGVYRLEDQQFIAGSHQGFERELLNSHDQVSLSCLCEEQQYNLAIFYPDKESLILSKMVILPVMSGLFFLVLVFTFIFTILALIRQKKISEIKTDFVNNMTHEFKTPIATISVSSEMLTHEPVLQSKERIIRYARIIYDENARLKKMVERVLQIATLEREELRLQLTVVSLHEIIQEAMRSFMVHLEEKKASLDSRLEAENDLIMADPVHLYNIVINLLDNAYKYAGDSPVIVIHTCNDHGRIVMEISDNGPGIRKEDQKRIFNKFHRLNRGDVHNVKGFGLGLYYVRSVVEKMDGRISVHSELNKGTTFTVNLPLKEQG
ncbi:MAG: hypothetical protein Kow00127_23770 [Bacteroidales bacterium]